MWMGAEWCPSQAQPRAMGLALWGTSTLRNDENEIGAEEEEVDAISSTGDPGNSSHTSPERSQYWPHRRARCKYPPRSSPRLNILRRSAHLAEIASYLRLLLWIGPSMLNWRGNNFMISVYKEDIAKRSRRRS